MDRRILPLLNWNQNELQFAESEENTFKNRIIAPVSSRLQEMLKKKLPKQKVKDLEKKLREAGNPLGLIGIDFLLLQIVISIGFILLLSLLILQSSSDFGKVLLLGSFSFAFLFGYSNYYLKAKKRQRIQQIEKTMPDFFDLVTISIEAGLGLDGALKRIANEMDGPLSEEFRYALEDMKLGKSRKQAFTEMKNRVSSEFLKSVLSALIQADQMGIGISKVLQAQTQRIREQQRQKVKEQAMKAPVKMLIPMVLFIFPTLFIVLIGPAFVQFITNWF